MTTERGMAMTRAPLSQLDDWQLVHDDQDIRGWPVQDAAGHRLGTVQELLVNTDTAYVDAIVLDTGAEYPASAIQIGEGLVLAPPATRGAAGAQDALVVPVAEERLKVAKRPAALGEVHLRKTVTAEQQTVPVELAREEVRVRERDVDDRPLRPGEAAFRGGTIRVPVRGEEAVVSKEAVVTGEVVLEKELVTERQQLADTVRKERVVVDEDDAR